MIVDHQDDRSSFQSFETQHVAVEHLLGVPETVPVGRGSLSLAVLLLGMAGAGGQKGEVLGPPAALEEDLDLVVADVESFVAVAGHESDIGSVSAEGTHRMVDEWAEGGGDLTGIADVVVED